MESLRRIAVSAAAAGSMFTGISIVPSGAQLKSQDIRVIGPIHSAGKLNTHGAANFAFAVQVTNDKDSGEGSLRAAILYANAHPGSKVRFPTDDLLVITPTSPPSGMLLWR